MSTHLKVPPTLPLATRIAHEIAEQLRHDNDIDERWMADWIEQEAIQPLLGPLKTLVEHFGAAYKETRLFAEPIAAIQKAETGQ